MIPDSFFLVFVSLDIFFFSFSFHFSFFRFIFSALIKRLATVVASGLPEIALLQETKFHDITVVQDVTIEVAQVQAEV